MSFVQERVDPRKEEGNEGRTTERGQAWEELHAIRIVLFTCAKAVSNKRPSRKQHAVQPMIDVNVCEG